MTSRKSLAIEPSAPQAGTAGPVSVNPLADATKSWEDAAQQYLFELQRCQAQATAVAERIRQETELELQRRWLEAYRSHAEALYAGYVSGPHVQEAAQAWQQLAEALRALQDVQPSLRAKQDAGQSAAQRMTEARGAGDGDAAERSRQVYADYLAQLGTIWDRRAAIEAAQRMQQDYYDKLRNALDTAEREAAASQQRYLAEVNAILSDDTGSRRLNEDLAPIQQTLAAALASAQGAGVDALIDSLRAYKARATSSPTPAAAPA
jgi:hypothetical protein